MNSITKLAAAALGALSIAGGVAVAQDNSTSNDARSDTANYGTPPGAPLKRDGSLSADPQRKATMSAPATTSNSTAAPMATPSTASDAAPVADTSTRTSASLRPRADRN